MSDSERAASPERLSPTHAGMTGDNAVRRFTYLLNAMELAAQAENPAEQGYAAKRKSVCDFVWLIGESLGDAMGRAGAARPGAADPRDELIVALDVLWRDYTDHDEDCPGVTRDAPDECTCGLSAAMTRISKARGALSRGAAEPRCATIREVRAAIPTEFWGSGSKWEDGSDPYNLGGNTALKCVASILDRLEEMPDAERIAALSTHDPSEPTDG